MLLRKTKKKYYKDRRLSDVEDTHREKAPSNYTPVLTKRMNMDIWVVGISNQIFIRGS